MPGYKRGSFLTAGGGEVEARLTPGSKPSIRKQYKRGDFVTVDCPTGYVKVSEVTGKPVIAMSAADVQRLGIEAMVARLAEVRKSLEQK